MEVRYKLLFLLSVSCVCNGQLQRLGGFLTEAHQHIHSKVQDVTGAVIGGFTSILGGQLGHRGHARPPRPQPNDGGETILVIVQETDQGNGDGPRPPYGPPHHHRYPSPPPNNGFNTHHPHPHPGHGQRPHQQNYGNRFPGHNQAPDNPHYNQGNNGNNYANNGNDNPNQNAYENLNGPSHNGNGFTNPEQNIPNLDGNYKPTEAYNDQQHNDAHKAENTGQEKHDKTTTKPSSDGPLFVPLNDYTYGGDKITVNAPKREADKPEPEVAEENDEEFPIDIRFKDE